jgi:hypothetical protein
MQPRLVRHLVSFLFALLGLFLILMFANRLGSLFGTRAPAPEKKAGDDLFYSRAKPAGVPPGTLPVERRGLAEVKAEGAIMIVKRPDFKEAAEKPKSLMASLNEMGGSKKKGPPAVPLKDSDLAKPLSVSAPPALPKLAADILEPGRGEAQEGATLFSAPVNYKLFATAELWKTFCEARRVKCAAHDFSREDLLILVSVSEFPDGIFRIAGVDAEGGQTVVKYRVDPLAMSEEASPAARKAYASAGVPRGRPVKLKQVP